MKREFLIGLLVLGLSGLSMVAQDRVPVDALTVQAKIHALGMRDDTIPNDERPQVWLWMHREDVVPQLIAGLGDPDVRVAEACLLILTECQPSIVIVNALLPIAGNEKHPINAAAMLALVRYGSDERASQLMARAFTDEKRFPKPLDRAALAAAGRKKTEAIAILKKVVAASEEDESDAFRAVAQLAQIGPDAVPALVVISQGLRWGAAAEAYLSLEKINPPNHALTADQREFLGKIGGRTSKAGTEFYRKRAQELAALDRRQIRPFVMQALISTGYASSRDALDILTFWKDKQALPKIKQLIEQNSRFVQYSDAMAAYLTIDAGAKSEQLLLRQAAGQSDSPGGPLLLAVLQATIPDERRVDLLLKVRDIWKGAPCALPNNLGHFYGDLATVLPSLMDRETDIGALGIYAEIAGNDKQQRFGPQILRAVHLFAEAAKKAAADDSEFVSAAKKILTAAAQQKLQGAEKDITALAETKSPTLRIAALSAAVSISDSLDENAKALLDELANPVFQIRSQAAHGLAGLILTDDDQRRQVETVLLKHLGKPTEDAALRLLANFGGADSVRLLQPIMDDSDVHRAVYAAWVLAQISDQPVRDVALRRLAIHGLFRRWFSQRSDGIGFQVAPGLHFGQTTDQYSNRDKNDYQKVQIPRSLLKPPDLTAAEQLFAVASYREACAHRESLMGGNPCPEFHGMDASYIPLLQMIATEDLRLDALFVKNQTVAYFPQRHDAAAWIARFTGQPGTYIGLGGEKLSSEQKPLAPYPDQEVLIAHFLIDRVLKELPDHRPETDAQCNEINWRNSLLANLVDAEHFGGQLQKAIIAEIRRRGLAERFRKMRLVEQWLTE